MKGYIGLKCKRGFTTQILRSNAGYYLGTIDEDEIPNCRLSDYFKTAEDAEVMAYPSRDAIEIEFCNGGCSCFY